MVHTAAVPGNQWLKWLLLIVCRFSADTAYSCDPRIKKFKEEEKARKESEKKAKAEAKKREQEEKERVSLIYGDSKCNLNFICNR